MASLFVCHPIQSAYTYSTGNMQLMSAENGCSHMFDVSSKSSEGVCEKKSTLSVHAKTV